MTFRQLLTVYLNFIPSKRFFSSHAPTTATTIVENYLPKSSKVIDDLRELYGDQLSNNSEISTSSSSSKNVPYFETLNIHPLAMDTNEPGSSPSSNLLIESQAQLNGRILYTLKRAIPSYSPNSYSEARKEFLLAIRDGLKPTSRICEALLHIYLTNLQFFFDQKHSSNSTNNTEALLSSSRFQVHANRLFILALELCHFMIASQISFGESFLIQLVELMYLANLSCWIDRWLLSPKYFATDTFLPSHHHHHRRAMNYTHSSSSQDENPTDIFHRRNSSRIPAIIETEDDLPIELRYITSPYLYIMKTHQCPRLFETALLRSPCSLDTAFVYFHQGIINSGGYHAKGNMIRINTGMEDHIRLISAFLENLSFHQSKTERGYKITFLVRLLKILIGECPLSIDERAHYGAQSYYKWLARSIEKNFNLTQYLLPLQSHLIKSSNGLSIDRNIPDFIHLQIIELWDALKCPEIGIAYGRLFCMNVPPSPSIASATGKPSASVTVATSGRTNSNMIDGGVESYKKSSLLPFNPLLNAMFMKILNKSKQFKSCMNILHYLEGYSSECLSSIIAHNRQCQLLAYPGFDETILLLENGHINSIAMEGIPISFVEIQRRRALLPCVSIAISGLCQIGPSFLPSAYALIQKYFVQTYPLLTKILRQNPNFMSLVTNSISAFSSSSSTANSSLKSKLLKELNYGSHQTIEQIVFPLSVLEEQMLLTFIFAIRDYYEKQSIEWDHLIICRDLLLWIEKNFLPNQLSRLFMLPKSSMRFISSKRDVPLESSNLPHYLYPSLLEPFPSFHHPVSSPFLQPNQLNYSEDFHIVISEINNILDRLIPSATL